MDIEAKFEQACKHIEYNQLTEAKEMLEGILAFKSDYFPAINKLGVICIKENDISRARSHFEKALSINPDYVPSIVNLGSVYNDEGDSDAAIKLYMKAIEKDEHYYLAYYNMAVLYKNLGKYDEYMKYLKQYRHRYKKYINDKEKESARRLRLMPNNRALFILAILAFIAVIYINR